MDRLQAMGKDRRFGAIALAVVLVLVIGVALFARSQGGSDAEQADEVLQEALQLHADGDLDGAEEAYLRVIQLDPQNQFAYYNLGLISQTRGDMVSAESSYRTAIAIDPDFVVALFNLAILRADAGATREAIDLYEHIIEVTPAEGANAETIRLLASAHLNLGFLLIEDGDQTRGEAELDEAVRLDPSLEDRIDRQSSAGDSPGESPSS